MRRWPSAILLRLSAAVIATLVGVWGCDSVLGLGNFTFTGNDASADGCAPGTN